MIKARTTDADLTIHLRASGRLEEVRQRLLEWRWVQPVLFGRRWSPYNRKYVVGAKKARIDRGPRRRRWAGHMELHMRMKPRWMDEMLAMD